MKPDWDKLTEDFKDSKTALVADVDCTAGGKELCEKHKVQGYPSIKWGDPTDLKDFEGGRSYADLKKFADENLGPTCGPDNLDLCDEANKGIIANFQKMDLDELDTKIEESDAKVKGIEAKSQKAVDKLNKKIEDLNGRIESETKKKDDSIAAETKKLGLGMMKKVFAAKKKKEEL